MHVYSHSLKRITPLCLQSKYLTHHQSINSLKDSLISCGNTSVSFQFLPPTAVLQPLAFTDFQTQNLELLCSKAYETPLYESTAHEVSVAWSHVRSLSAVLTSVILRCRYKQGYPLSCLHVSVTTQVSHSMLVLWSYFTLLLVLFREFPSSARNTSSRIKSAVTKSRRYIWPLPSLLFLLIT